MLRAFCFQPQSLSDSLLSFQFYPYTILPLSVLTICISFLLKPRRNTIAYKAVLYMQYFIFTLGSELFDAIGYKWERSETIASLSFSASWLCCLPIMWRVRARIAKLSDDDLSKYLSNYVIGGGLVVGLGQLTFLALSTLQCESEAR